nr:MAG TPA: hypothetical protein [Caudoviricetes sp.]DAS11885.1 MAG TPA: hypothetical protein [Caudoviricetes sp.]DAS43561.1 MAG TPA: hypothetical protein [Caudoviricetes sp.]DAS89015.1 MAG TPA: hypothetical protein [Caudoviricetes sp.]
MFIIFTFLLTWAYYTSVQFTTPGCCMIFNFRN